MTTLPEERQVIYGRTFPSCWNPTNDAAALECPSPRGAQRIKDVLFGLAMAGAVALVLYAMLRGWVFGAQR